MRVGDFGKSRRRASGVIIEYNAEFLSSQRNDGPSYQRLRLKSLFFIEKN